MISEDFAPPLHEVDRFSFESQPQKRKADIAYNVNKFYFYILFFV